MTDDLIHIFIFNIDHLLVYMRLIYIDGKEVREDLLIA
jgi:hypothetical protein